MCTFKNILIFFIIFASSYANPVNLQRKIRKGNNYNITTPFSSVEDVQQNYNDYYKAIDNNSGHSHLLQRPYKHHHKHHKPAFFVHHSDQSRYISAPQISRNLRYLRAAKNKKQFDSNINSQQLSSKVNNLSPNTEFAVKKLKHPQNKRNLKSQTYSSIDVNNNLKHPQNKRNIKSQTYSSSDVNNNLKHLQNRRNIKSQTYSSSDVNNNLKHPQNRRNIKSQTYSSIDVNNNLKHPQNKRNVKSQIYSSTEANNNSPNTRFAKRNLRFLRSAKYSEESNSDSRPYLPSNVDDILPTTGFDNPTLRHLRSTQYNGEFNLNSLEFTDEPQRERVKNIRDHLKKYMDYFIIRNNTRHNFVPYLPTPNTVVFKIQDNDEQFRKDHNSRSISNDDTLKFLHIVQGNELLKKREDKDYGFQIAYNES